MLCGKKFGNIHHISTNQYLDRCTGSFQEDGKTPPSNTKCFYPCIQDAGRWGKNYCYTNPDKSQWGAECVACQGNIRLTRNLLSFNDI